MSYNPALEEVLAMVWSGHTFREWEELEGSERAYLMAAHRVSRQIEAVVAHEQYTEARDKSRARG